MQFAIARGWSIGLFLISFAALLASDVSAIGLPSSVWSSLKWPSVLSMYERPLQYLQKPDPDLLSSDIWEIANKLGDSVLQYTYTILRYAAHSNVDAAGRIHDFENTMKQVCLSTTRFRYEIQRGAQARGLTLDNISEMLSAEMATLLAELKAEFPSPDEADHHKERGQMVHSALLKMEEGVVRVSTRCGVPESNARAYFRNIEPHLLRVIVTVGDLVEQHPVLLETLLFSGAILILPEMWFLRPILSIFGFGPSGPVKGSSAAWMQRRFWGAAVAKRSWFARLQSAGMTPGTGKKVIGSIIGIIASLFKCR